MYPGRIDIGTLDDIQIGVRIVIANLINDVGDSYQSDSLYSLGSGFWVLGSSCGLRVARFTHPRPRRRPLTRPLKNSE